MAARVGAVVLALVAVVAVAVVLVREAPVEQIPLTVSVPTQPGSRSRLDLDAMIYRTAVNATGDPTPRPALLLAHGFGADRTSLDEAAVTWARRGYTVMTWSARGFGASGGQITLDDPDREIADISGLVDVLAERDDVVSDARGDPRVGIAGGSYGGGASLLAATQEPRLDAVVAIAAWHDLAAALAPDRAGGVGVPKAQWLSLLFTAGGLNELGTPSDGVGGGLTGQPLGTPAVLATVGPRILSCGRFDEEVCAAYQSSASGDRLTESAAALLSRANPAGQLDDVSAPTMLIQGQDDTLFDLGQSLGNARELLAAGSTVALRWVDAGHTGLGAIGSRTDDLTLAWLNRWLPIEGDVAPAPGADRRDPVDQVFGWTDTASGEPQSASTLPGADPDGQTLDFHLTGAGDLSEQPQPGTAAVALVNLVHPAGGLPAAITTLPGLGALGGLLPAVDIPGQSLSFSSDALADDLTLLGQPRLLLGTGSPASADTSTDALSPVVFVKLFDVSPGGSARLLQSDVNPLRLDGPTEVTLGPVAHRIVAGNRLRLTLATTDQGFDTGSTAAVIPIPVGADSRLVLPVATTATANPLPAAVRILIPVVLVVALAVAAAVLMRRRDALLARAVPAADAPPVRIRRLAKRYADGKVAVDGVDLVVGRGQVFGLLGPNGAGKTTTMRMLLGLIRPSDGEVELLGHRVSSGHPLFHRVGVLVEGPGFAPYLTGRQNLTSYWRAGGRPLAEANLARALDVADLGPAIDRPSRTYSHGMRQRLAIAQALLGDPELLVLDEPTDGLDPEQIRGMRELLARLGREGTTVLVSSHLLAEVEQMCTHVAVMQAGRVLASGPVAELMGATRSIVVAVSDQTAARAALAGLIPSDQIGVEGGGLVISLGGSRIADIVTVLVTAGVEVSAVTPRGRLEDTFLELTGAGPASTSDSLGDPT